MHLTQDQEDLSTKYTVIKLVDLDHINKLIKYLDEHKDNRKTSYCRFYLRGLCIMKSQHCRFAHDFDQLNLHSEEYNKISIFDWTLGEKEQKKRFFLEKTDFHQRPLFFIKNLDYLWLQSYQFTQRYKKSGNQPLSIAQINKNDAIRNRIREIMHREQWDKFIDYIEALCPDVDYTISMFSTWFGKIGFEKAQTFCKFGDFIRYLTYVKGYAEVNIVVPPLTSRSVYFIKHKSTYMVQQLEAIKEDSQIYKSNVRKNKEERMKKLPQDLYKRFICRFYMAGNCEKERNQCPYVHNIEDLRYDPNIDFLPAYRQPPKSKQDRLNYISLHRYYVNHKAPNDQAITLQDINSKFGFKDKIRKRVHLQLYTDFLRKIEEIFQDSFLKLAVVKKEYTRFGFNHTDENKFGQLEAVFWDLGFHQQDIVDHNREKHQYVYRIPAVQEMDKLYYCKILTILKEEIDLSNIGKGDYQQILESSIRRLIYSQTSKQQFQIPLHVYLRKKGVTLKNVLEQNFIEYCPFIFFESSQENFKKLLDLLKKYFKKQKKFMYRMDDVDSFIRGLSKEEINMNNFVNLKNLIELALLELGKEIYFWPLGNASIVVDRSHANKNLHHSIQLQEKPLQEIEIEKYHKYWNQWMVVVNSEETFNFCRFVISHCNVYGVDLEGKLSQNGYIDFIQVSCSLMKKKHIFILDVYLLQQKMPELFLQVQHFLKSIFQSENLLKIMHACQQDSIALYSCLGIRVKNVFDTSGVDIYLQQMKNYREMRELNHTFQHTLKKVRCTKTPGLNQILEKWQAPKGANQYKESMKKVFTEAPRSYFTTRPIVEEFQLYSARDVEDLIEVWQKMSKAESDGLWHVIGEIYTPID